MKKALVELVFSDAADLLGQLNVPTEILDRGACVGANPEIFDGETTEAIQEAKSICGGCPVKQKCLAWAVANESFGIWGGTTPEERNAINAGKTVISIEERLWAAQVRADLESNLTADEIAERHGVTPRTVFRWRNRLAA